MATKNGLVTLVISEADYREIENAINARRDGCDRKTNPGTARYALLTHIINNLGVQHLSQTR